MTGALRLITHNENRLARFCLFEAISVDGRRDVGMRDPEHGHGDCLSRDNEMDHRRCGPRESTGQIAAATHAGGGRISPSARVQCAAHRAEQHV
jgi:hypothetical protein